MGDDLEQVLEGKTLEDIVHSLPCSHPIQVEIDRLKADLEEGQQERENLRSHIYGLRGVVENLEQQLAEARAAKEELEENYLEIGCLSDSREIKELKDKARQEAAKEIVLLLESMFWFQPPRENEPVIYRDQTIDAIKEKFGLEI